MPAPLGGPSFSRSRCCRLARRPNPRPTVRRGPGAERRHRQFPCRPLRAVGRRPRRPPPTDLLKAVAQSPGDPELTLQAFIACLDAGRPEAVKLARQLPDSQVAQLVLADVDIKAGHWQAAEQRFHALPRQGLTQLLQPLLVAWAQQGDGRTDTALSTLRPYVENPRFRGMFALHAAMIADLGNRPDEAARLYRTAEIRDDGAKPAAGADPGKLAGALRPAGGGAAHAGGAARRWRRIWRSPCRGCWPMSPSGRCRGPIDGIAEAYFTFAALLRGAGCQRFRADHAAAGAGPAAGFRRGAGCWRPTSCTNQHHPQAALRMLNEVPATDPLIAAGAAAPGGAGRPAGTLGRGDARPGAPGARLSRQPAAGRAARRHPAHQAALSRCGRGLRQGDRPDHAARPRPTGWCSTTAASPRSGRTNGRRPRPISITRWSCRPDQPFVLNYLAYSWADMGHHLTEARQMIQRAAERRPNDGAITDSLGWVMFRQGDINEAVKTLEQAVELEPEDSTINGHLGDAYWAAGRKIEAQYQWRRALTLNPAPDDAAKLEAKLNTGALPSRGHQRPARCRRWPVGMSADGGIRAGEGQPSPACVGRRDDGYHLLDSLVVFAGVGDRLTATPAIQPVAVGHWAVRRGLQREADNLVLRAARPWRPRPVSRAAGTLVLEKNLPVASGIGGGSADAAAALRLLVPVLGVWT